MAAGDARPVPQKNVAYRVTFPILDADGDLVTAAGALDSEISKDGGTFADCTNEATEIATSSGMYFLDLTATEMNADTVAIIVKSTSGKTTPIVLYPEEAGDLRVNVTQWNSATVATPTVAGVPEVDLTHMEGVTQSVTDLKDFADAGYDPATNKVEGVKLADTVTTNTDMRGTDNAALASVVGALADAAAAGDPTATDTLMQYVKQLVNVLVGTTGVTTFPAAAAPANNVSLAEIIRAIYDDSNSLDGTKIPDTLSLANINAEVDTALDTAIPGSPTANSINERVAAIDDKLPTGTISDFDETADNVTVGTNNDKTGYSLSGTLTTLDSAFLRVNTAQAGAAGTITLDASASATNDLFNGCVIGIVSGTGVGQARLITDYVGATKVASIEPNWTTNPSSDSVFVIWPAGNVDLRTATQTSVDAIETDTNSLNDTKIPDTISLANINAEVDTALDTAIPGSPTANSINERVAAIDDKLPAGTISDFDEASDNVSIAAGGFTSSSSAAGAFDAAALAADAASEIAAAVLDEVFTTHTTAETLGAFLNAVINSALTTKEFTVQTDAGNSTTQFKTNLTEATDDHYKGRTVIFSGTGVMVDQATDITAYDGTNKIITVTAMTETPPDGATGVIV